MIIHGRLPSPMLRFGAMVILLALSACSRGKGGWTEQVLLDGGEIVIVQKTEEYEKRMPIGDAAQSFTLRGELKILDQTPDAPPWIDARNPILLLRDPATKEFVLVASTVDSRVWSRHGRPLNPYWMFRLRNSEWKEEPMADFVFGHATNLVVTYGRAEQKGSLVTLEDKRQWNEKANVIRRYRRVEKHYQFGRD